MMRQNNPLICSFYQNKRVIDEKLLTCTDFNVLSILPTCVKTLECHILALYKISAFQRSMPNHIPLFLSLFFLPFSVASFLLYFHLSPIYSPFFLLFSPTSFAKTRCRCRTISCACFVRSHSVLG